VACDEERGTVSVTVYGRAVEAAGAEEAECRELHRLAHPGYTQFIVDEAGGIAVLLVRIEQARMCDVRDSVSSWSRPAASPT
jgi:hypothetical protein